MIRLKCSWSQDPLESCLQRTKEHTDGLAAEPVPGAQHRDSLQAMPLARSLLLFFPIQSYNKQPSFRRKHSLPQNRTKANLLATGVICKDLELKGIKKQSLKCETHWVKPDDQIRRMPGQGTKALVSALQLLGAECILYLKDDYSEAPLS